LSIINEVSTMKKITGVVLKGRRWTEEDIRVLLETNDTALLRALVKVYEFQTKDEKRREDTIYNNGVGFNGADGKILTSIAGVYRNGWVVSPKQIHAVRRRMRKYVPQLMRILAEAQTF
jgi:hypothetical protein